MAQTPFRYRHDGWTPARQAAFLRALRETRCVTAACRHVGLSDTSARRVYRRIPAFAEAWDLALAFDAGALDRAAYVRAVEGWLEPIVRGGEVVAHRRRYSDAMLRLLIEREDRRAADKAGVPLPVATREQTDASILRKLAALDKGHKRDERERMLAWADEMVRAGKAP